MVESNPHQVPENSTQTLEERWKELKSRRGVGQRVTGTVIRREPFGVFLDIGERFTAFVDVAEVKDGTIRGMADFPEIGDQVEGTIIQLNDSGHAIYLSLRRLSWARIGAGDKSNY